MRSLFDVEAMGRGVLGDQWKTASAPQRNEFADVMFEQISRSLIRRIGPRPEALEFLGERKIGAEILASSRLTIGAIVVNLDWRLRGSRVVDVLIDGRSVMASRREDYNSRLAANGNSIAALTASLREDLIRTAN